MASRVSITAQKHTPKFVQALKQRFGLKDEKHHSNPLYGGPGTNIRSKQSDSRSPAGDDQERPDFDDEKPTIANINDFDASDLTDLGQEMLSEILTKDGPVGGGTHSAESETISSSSGSSQRIISVADSVENRPKCTDNDDVSSGKHTFRSLKRKRNHDTDETSEIKRKKKKSKSKSKRKAAKSLLSFDDDE
eukprot:491505_1